MSTANALDISKSQLGKLLASENIRIEHRQITGPYFDVKERVLALPIWKDVDADLYDLMIGHEVGHALFTPAEGWDEKVKKEGKTYKTLLNLIEDARIEKKMKRKYPGLRRPMFNGYTTLVDRGFFGVTWKEMNALPFVDRLNIFFKLGSRSNITFSETEMDFISRVENAETWDDVIHLSDELFNIAKDEKNKLEEMFEEYDNADDTSDLRDSLEDMMSGRDDSFNDSSLDSDSDDTTDSNASGSSDNESEESSEEKKNSSTNNESKNGKAGGNNKNAISESTIDKLRDYVENDTPDYSITDNAMKDKEDTLIDEKAYPYLYLNMPNIDISKWVIPAKSVHASMNIVAYSADDREKIYSNFMVTNKPYVSYLVKEFEMRRNAKQFAKARVSKTGELDIDKVWKYRMSEDLFMQSTIVPNGKNHGMMMVVDLSGSMQDNMQGTLEQIVSLSLFCRKVGIPFEVYGFNDNGMFRNEFAHAGIDIGGEDCTRSLRTRNVMTEGSLFIPNSAFRLQQLLHDRMGLNEFNNAIKNLLFVAEGFGNYRRSWSKGASNSAYVPRNMELGGTPLNEAMMVLSHVALKFKARTKVEILNTIILTDGDASYGLNYVHNNEAESISSRSKIIIDHKETRSQVVMSGVNRYNMTIPLIELYKKMTGSRIVGYYLMSGRNYKYQIESKVMSHSESGDFDHTQFERQYSEEFSKYKFYGLKTKGYDVYYMIPGSELEIHDVTLDGVLKNNTTPTKQALFTAFKKTQKSKQISRVFLNQFIQYIS